MKINKKSIHILMSEYKVDSRVRNETETLNEIMNVEVYCLKDESGNFLENRAGITLKRFGIRTNNKYISFISSYLGMMVHSFSNKIDIVHAHDLNALLVGYIISRIKRAELVYDSHELWSESKHGNYPNWLLKLVKNIEVYFAKRADHIITVSDSIKKHLVKLFSNEKVTVLRNVPSYTHEGSFDLFREMLDIEKGAPIFLYQGLISESRGVFLILDALDLIPKDSKFQFIYLGDGPDQENLKKKIVQKKLSHYVHVLDAVSQDDLLKYTSSADIGVHALDNSCLNHDYCLPNKIFEYVNAGIGVICPNLTELKRFITKEDVGSLYETGNAKALSQQITYCIEYPDRIIEYKRASAKSRKSLNWDVEKQNLIKVYEGL
ncbi:glycosyltransferase [Vibrio sp. HN007]|uniref:glycosyltransferase n=1 Tax=Vibrio iocasae TaxID=3098914 RepID=UPI0035D4F8D1